MAELMLRVVVIVLGVACGTMAASGGPFDKLNAVGVTRTRLRSWCAVSDGRSGRHQVTRTTGFS